MANHTVQCTPPLPRPLPAEILLEILHNILICPCKLAFCQLPKTAKKAPENQRQVIRKYDRSRNQTFSKVLRLALLNNCTDNEPRAKFLTENFNSLSLVSRNVRSMAREVFFSENRWVLHTSSIFDATQWVAKHWGADALGLMRDVRIELQNDGQTVFHALETFVAAANERRNLKYLSVQWLGCSRPLQCAYSVGRTWHYHPMARDLEVERNSEGGRGELPADETFYRPRSCTFGDEESEDDIPEGSVPKVFVEPEGWIKKEVVLLPLGNLRGCQEARIEGVVRESWAVWLEGCITASQGQLVPDFEFEEVGLQAIEDLKRQE